MGRLEAFERPDGEISLVSAAPGVDPLETAGRIGRVAALEPPEHGADGGRRSRWIVPRSCRSGLATANPAHLCVGKTEASHPAARRSFRRERQATV
jgi:hypothetical protein